MRKLLAVAKRELLELSKQPVAFLWTLALPLIMIVFLGNIINFGSSSTAGGKFAVSVPVVNNDNTAGAQQFLDSFKNIPGVAITWEPSTLTDAKEHVQTKADRGAYLVIPAGFGQAYQNHQPTTIQIFSSPTDSGGQVIAQLLQSYADHYNTDGLMVAAAQSQATKSGGTFDATAAGQQAEQLQSSVPPLLKVEAEATTGTNFNSFDQIAPGYATMFLIFGLQTVVATILSDRSKGTLRRLAVTPLPRWAYMGGKMLAQFAVSLLQVVVMLSVAKIFFNANINMDNAFGIFLMIIVLSFAATALGMLLVSVLRTQRAVEPAITIVALVGSMVGGAFFPLWLMPDWVQGVSRIFINSWAMSGFNDLMIFRQDITHVLPDIFALLVYGSVCLFVAVRLFRYNEA